MVCSGQPSKTTTSSFISQLFAFLTEKLSKVRLSQIFMIKIHSGWLKSPCQKTSRAIRVYAWTKSMLDMSMKQCWVATNISPFNLPFRRSSKLHRDLAVNLLMVHIARLIQYRFCLERELLKAIIQLLTKLNIICCILKRNQCWEPIHPKCARLVYLMQTNSANKNLIK